LRLIYNKNNDKLFLFIVVSFFIHLSLLLILEALPNVKTFSKKDFIKFSVVKKTVKSEKVNKSVINNSIKKKRVEKPLVKKKIIKKSSIDKKVIDATKVKKIEKIPPSTFKSKIKPKVKPKKVMPVFGLNPNSVKGKGGESGFRVGNTLYKEPEKKMTDPDKVKAYNKPFKPVSLLTELPKFKTLIKPIYPDKEKKSGIEGVVILEIKIDEKGNVFDVTIIKSAGKNFDKAAVASIKKTVFYPGKIKGEAVPVKIRVPIRFRLVE